MLWKLYYTESLSLKGDQTSTMSKQGSIGLPRISHDLSFDDSILDVVREAWDKLTTEDADRGEFLQFKRREDTVDEDEDDEDTI